MSQKTESAAGRVPRHAPSPRPPRPPRPRPPTARIVHNPEQLRYEAYVGDQLAGFASYHVHGESVVFLETAIDAEFRGRGLGHELIRGAVADVHANGRHPEALCPFVAGYLSQADRDRTPASRAA